jgi:alcohol dehydrogenase
VQQLTFLGPGSAEWREAPSPTLQGPAEALARPLAVTTCDLDTAVLKGRVPAAPGMALGHEFIAEVIDVGDEVRDVEIGGRYVVPFQISCGACSNCRRGLTGSCLEAPRLAMYGLSSFGGGDWGGALSDLVRVPYADAMLVALPEGADTDAVAAVSDNLSDAYRCVAGPLRDEPGAAVLVVGGGGAESIGLYACDIARRLGAGSVAYVDHDPDRLALAGRLGCEPVEADADVQEGIYEGRFPDRLEPRPITVDASGHHAGLALALRSTAAGGVCTSPSIYFEPLTPVPLLEMYTTGVTLHTSRVQARATMPEVLDLIVAGTLDPRAIEPTVAPWDEAEAAMADPPTKLLITRGA